MLHCTHSKNRSRQTGRLFFSSSLICCSAYSRTALPMPFKTSVNRINVREKKENNLTFERKLNNWTLDIG